MRIGILGSGLMGGKVIVSGTLPMFAARRRRRRRPSLLYCGDDEKAS